MFLWTVVQAPPPALYDWTGAYVGLFMGAVSGNNFWAETGANGAATPGAFNGTPIGLTLGYDWQSGAMVYGAALDYTGSSITATSTSSLNFNCATGCMTNVNNSYALRGRIGYAVDDTLFYATAGFAAGSATATVTGLGTLGAANLTGWTAGIGFEHALSQHLSITMEYLYSDLGRLQIPTLCGTNCYTDVNYGTLRLGANYRF